jgi:hypothetical protein
MRRQRLTITATLLVAAMPGVAPAIASAGPLLSGYGGPGQGNQAILGSAVVNNRSGGGGSGSGGSGSGRSSPGASSGGAAGAGIAAPGAGTAPRSTTGASAGAKGGVPAAASHSNEKQAKRPLAGTSGRSAATSASSSSLTASRGGAGGSQPLGLSGADLLYILLAFGVLVFTGILTRSLARGRGVHADRPLKRCDAAPE